MSTSTSSIGTRRKGFPLVSALSAFFSEGITSTILKFLGVIFLILNLKNIPTSWHFRVLRAFFHQVNRSKEVMTRRDLFKPLVTTTYNSLLDCDYNLHKSNSTYFKDLDVARAHYISALLRTGLRRMHAGDREGLPPLNELEAKTEVQTGRKVPNTYIIALGGVACMFRKEIKPLSCFEVWTRLLAWDEKWIYTVSHVVRAGAVRPRGYSLQPWKDTDKESFPASLLQRLGLRRKSKPHPSRRVKATATASTSTTAGDSSGDEKLSSLLNGEQNNFTEELRRAVYATSIARYVCKKGRAVIPPEIVLERSRLLPEGPRPASVPDLRFGHTFRAPSPPPSSELTEIGSGGDALPNGSASVRSLDSEPSGTETPNSSAAVPGPENGLASIEGRLGTALDASAQSGSADELTWEQVNTMRLEGLKYASQFDGLAGLHDEFAKDGDEVLGVYGDLIY